MESDFEMAVEAVGGKIKHFSGVSEAVRFLADLAGGGRVAASCLPGHVRAALGALVGDDVNPADAALCISRAEAGIAATGSLLIDLGQPDGRRAVALAPKHAVFLDPCRVVPTLTALEGNLQAVLSDGNGVYFSLTTGPSRTADIERVLTIGVHGPKELYVLLVEGV